VQRELEIGSGVRRVSRHSLRQQGPSRPLRARPPSPGRCVEVRDGPDQHSEKGPRETASRRDRQPIRMTLDWEIIHGAAQVELRREKQHEK
jgi:hypothetical protein